MSNSECFWDVYEDKQLINLYSKYKMDISEIAKIHKRSILSIEKRLEKFGLIINCKDNSCKNFVWDKFIELQTEMRKKNIQDSNRYELICKAVSESINDKFKEYNDKIENLQLCSLD